MDDALAPRQVWTNEAAPMRDAQLEDCITADIDFLNARRRANVRAAAAGSNRPRDGNASGMLRTASAESRGCSITGSGSNVPRSVSSRSILWSHGSMTSIEGRAAVGTKGAGRTDRSAVR
jgi:hypothetical protein